MSDSLASNGRSLPPLPVLGKSQNMDIRDKDQGLNFECKCTSLTRAIMAEGDSIDKIRSNLDHTDDTFLLVLFLVWESKSVTHRIR